LGVETTGDWLMAPPMGSLCCSPEKKSDLLIYQRQAIHSDMGGEAGQPEFGFGRFDLDYFPLLVLILLSSPLLIANNARIMSHPKQRIRWSFLNISHLQ